jgi:LemA protein
MADLMGATAGWYLDPQGTANLRWWDGVQWTAHLVPQPDGAIDEPAEFHALAWTHGGRLHPAPPASNDSFALALPLFAAVGVVIIGVFLFSGSALPPQLLIFAGLGLVSALAVGWPALWNRWRILDTPTLDAAGARPGVCEIAGHVEPLPGATPLVAHLSGTPVLGYRVAVERRESRGNKVTWVERWSYTNVEALRSGFLVRSPGGGTITVRLGDPSRALRETAVAHEVQAPGRWRLGQDRFRLRESGLALHDAVFCLGEASLADDGRVVLEDPRFIAHGDERSALRAEAAKVVAAITSIVTAVVTGTALASGSVRVATGDEAAEPTSGVDLGLLRLVGLVLAVCAVLAGIALTIRWWNRLIALREQVRAAWGHIEADLQRRHDTVTRLVPVVSAAAAHEAGTLALAAARGQPEGALHGGVPDDRRVHSTGEAIGASSAPERRLVALAEAHPSLRTDANFRQLFDQLAAAENRIAAGRRFYNDAITLLDTRVDRLPGLLVRRRVLPRPRPTLLRFDDAALATVGHGWVSAPPPPPPPAPMPPPPTTRPPLPPPPPPAA